MSMDSSVQQNASKAAQKKVIDIEITTTENGYRKITAPMDAFSSTSKSMPLEQTIVIQSLNTLACATGATSESSGLQQSGSINAMSKSSEQSGLMEDANTASSDKTDDCIVIEPEDCAAAKAEVVMDVESSCSPPAFPSNETVSKLTTEEIQSIIHTRENKESDSSASSPDEQLSKRKTRGNTMENIRKVIKLEQTNNEMLLKDEDYSSQSSANETDSARKSNGTTVENGNKDAQDWHERLTGKDGFCWMCHKPINKDNGITCSTCPRAFHTFCSPKSETPSSNAEIEVLIKEYQCVECIDLTQKESFNNNKNVNPMFLKTLLLSVYSKIMGVAMDTPFAQASDEKSYSSLVVNPMDTSKVYDRIKTFHYKSLQRFLSDINWIYHNSMIAYRNNKKVIKQAKDIVNICAQEIKDMKNCPTCYHNSTVAADWFTKPCPSPHMVVWARLKGFPFWPAKVMSSSASGSLDVRFFGEHDRAWIKKSDCLLYSTTCPKAPTPRGLQRTTSLMSNLEIAMKEANQYFENLSRVYGDYTLAKFKIPFDPAKHSLKIYFSNFSNKKNSNSKENQEEKGSPVPETVVKQEVVEEEEESKLPPLKLKLSNISPNETREIASKLDIRRSKRFTKTGKMVHRKVDSNAGPKLVRPLVIRLEQCRFKSKSKKRKEAETKNAAAPLLTEIKKEKDVEEENKEATDNTNAQKDVANSSTVSSPKDNAKKMTLCRETRRARLAKYTKRKLNGNKGLQANGDFSDEIPPAKRLLLSALNIRQKVQKPHKSVQTEQAEHRQDKCLATKTVQTATQTDEKANGEVVNIMYDFLCSFNGNADGLESRQRIRDTCDKIVDLVRRDAGPCCRCECKKGSDDTLMGADYRGRVVGRFRDRFDEMTGPLIRTIRDIGEECVAFEVSQLQKQYGEEVSLVKEQLFETIERIKREFGAENNKSSNI